MLHSPKNLICPSLNACTCANTRRHSKGDTNGSMPSKISAKASPSPRASNSVSLVKIHLGMSKFVEGHQPSLLRWDSLR